MNINSFSRLNDGYQFEDDSVLIFFGNRESSLESWSKQHTKFQCQIVKQVHGNHIVSYNNSNNDIKEADGLWTHQSHVSLGIITADCVPIFLWDSQGKLIMGLHAGWRGIAQNILSHGLNIFTQKGIPLSTIRIVIGPHININNFEVREDALNPLLKTIATSTHSSIYRKKANDIFLVNLQQVLLQQIHSHKISREQIHTLPIDTYTDQQFHSYRRDKTKAGRQISFITRIK